MEPSAMRDDLGKGHSLAKFQQHKRLDEQINSSIHRSKDKPKGAKSSLTSSSLHRPHQRHQHQQHQPLSPRSKEELRLKVNARERQRMHDMNSALDALRMAMPYARGPSVKKLSKMNTLLLARNYILLLTKTTEDLRRMLAEAVSYGGSLANWPAKLDANVLLGSVQDAYDKQRRYADELLRQQQQQQKDDEKVLLSWKQRPHGDRLLTTDGVKNFEVADATATGHWSRVIDDHKSVKRHRESPSPNDAKFPVEFPKRSKLENSLEIPSEESRDPINNRTQEAEVLREKTRLVDDRNNKSGRGANKNLRSTDQHEDKRDDDDDDDDDAKTGKFRKEDADNDDEDDDDDEEVVVDSSFSLDDGEQSEVTKTGDQNNKAANDVDEDDARHSHHLHHHHHHSRVQPLLLSSLLASSPSSSSPTHMADEMVTSTTKRSAFQLVDHSRAGSVPSPEQLSLQKLSTSRPPQQRQDDFRKMAIQAHFPFFIPPTIPAYHHHHHHHLLHPFLTHPPGGLHAPAGRHHVMMTSLLENSHVVGTCPCRLCLPKDPL